MRAKTLLAAEVLREHRDDQVVLVVAGRRDDEVGRADLGVLEYVGLARVAVHDV